MIQLDIKQEVREALREELDRRDERIARQVVEALKSEWIGLEEVANALGYKRRQSASDWLKRHPKITTLWDERPIRVHRQEFNQRLYELGH